MFVGILQKMISLQTCLIKILPLMCSFFFTEDDIPTNMSYQDTTLQIKGSVLIRPVCRDVIFCKEKIQIKGGILIRHVCRDVIFCKEKIQIKGSVVFSLQKMTSLQTGLIKTLPLICSFFLYRRWHPYKHVLSRYYPWCVVFS
jgi:hypothetical protein